MKSTALRPRGGAARVLVLTAALCLALLAGGCGPGVGGTGTGTPQASLDYFGATAASVCGSDLAAQLPCPSATPGGPNQTASVGHFADSATAPQVTLRVEGDGIDLDAPCAGLSFTGVWGVQPGQAGRYYGQVDDGVQSQPATLSVTATADGVAVQLLDAKMQPLLGPLALQRLAAVPSSSVCR